jgi:hypothetical protein
MPTPDLKLTANLEALLGRLRPDDIEALPPTRRQCLGTLLRHWANRCELRAATPNSSLRADDVGRRPPPTFERVEVEDFPDS